jgi:hypothetical protein
MRIQPTVAAALLMVVISGCGDSEAEIPVDTTAPEVAATASTAPAETTLSDEAAAQAVERVEWGEVFAAEGVVGTIACTGSARNA